MCFYRFPDIISKLDSCLNSDGKYFFCQTAIVKGECPAGFKTIEEMENEEKK